MGCSKDLAAVLRCRETFRDCVRKYREQADVHHHFVEKRNNLKVSSVVPAN